MRERSAEKRGEACRSVQTAFREPAGSQLFFAGGVRESVAGGARFASRAAASASPLARMLAPPAGIGDRTFSPGSPLT